MHLYRLPLLRVRERLARNLFNPSTSSGQVYSLPSFKLPRLSLTCLGQRKTISSRKIPRSNGLENQTTRSRHCSQPIPIRMLIPTHSPMACSLANNARARNRNPTSGRDIQVLDLNLCQVQIALSRGTRRLWRSAVVLA